MNTVVSICALALFLLGNLRACVVGFRVSVDRLNPKQVCARPFRNHLGDDFRVAFFNYAHAGMLNRRADLLLVEIALRRIDGAIAHLERIGNAALAFVLRHLIYAIAQLRHLNAV